MKVLEINTVPYGSTATISYGISKVAQENGIECKVAYGYSFHPQINKSEYHEIGSLFDKALHMYLANVTGLHGRFSYFQTHRFVRWIKDFNPDIIHLHNIHGWFINIPILVDYINKNNKKVVWTFHDCWPFTGHCPYYDAIGCEKWVTGCNHCPVHKQYPKTIFDVSSYMYRQKKEWFCSINKLTIVTPSIWLRQQVGKSFLKSKECIVINNGIDLSKFKIIPHNYRKDDKFKILCVSYAWDKRKGLDAIIELSSYLDERFVITLVGTDEKVDSLLPPSINSIHRTQNQEELIELYNSSDVFLNPTREDNFPTVNIEAIACGLPVITFCTGGSPEIIDETCGIVVEKNNIKALADAILYAYNNPFSRNACRDRAQRYNKNLCFMNYINLYRKMYGE